MNRTPDSRAVRLLVLAGLLLGAGRAAACNVPVFRFALDRWPPRDYDVVVFHKGPLAPDEGRAVDALAGDSAGGTGRANLKLSVVDLGGDADEPMRELFAEQNDPVLPWAVVRTVNVDKEPVTVWAGKLGEEAVAGLLDSPARREMVKRILAGETAVWVLLECGDSKADDVAARLLETELKRVAPLLKLPELTDAPEDRISDKGPPLRIAFSVLRLRRDDPNERALVSMLLRSEADLAERREPMAFVAFGRGHCLAAYVGRGLNSDNVRKACSLLLAPCTCDVQDELARFELLVRGDWQTVGEEDRRSEAAREEPSYFAPAGEPRDEETAPLVPRPLLLSAIGVVTLLVVLTGARALRPGRRGPD